MSAEERHLVIGNAFADEFAKKGAAMHPAHSETTESEQRFWASEAKLVLQVFAAVSHLWPPKPEGLRGPRGKKGWPSCFGRSTATAGCRLAPGGNVQGAGLSPGRQQPGPRGRRRPAQETGSRARPERASMTS
jgi:hypothetical protein